AMHREDKIVPGPEVPSLKNCRIAIIFQLPSDPLGPYTICGSIAYKKIGHSSALNSYPKGPDGESIVASYDSTAGANCKPSSKTHPQFPRTMPVNHLEILAQVGRPYCSLRSSTVPVPPLDRVKLTTRCNRLCLQCLLDSAPAADEIRASKSAYSVSLNERKKY